MKYKEIKVIEKARYRERAMVYSIMKNYFPNDKSVLVDVSW